MRVAIEQGNIPLDRDTSEALVAVSANGKIAEEEHLKFDVGFEGNASQQGRLILNGMADKIGQPRLSAGWYCLLGTANWRQMAHRAHAWGITPYDQEGQESSARETCTQNNIRVWVSQGCQCIDNLDVFGDSKNSSARTRPHPLRLHPTAYAVERFQAS